MYRVYVWLCAVVGLPSVTGDARRRRAVRKSGSVGGSRMMECDIDYPRDRYVEHITTWRKRGSEVRRSAALRVYHTERAHDLFAARSTWNGSSFVLSLQPETPRYISRES